MESLSYPHWLPNLLSLSSAPHTLFEELFEVFEAQIISGRLRFRRRPVFYERQIVDGYPLGFWHLIERENYSVDERQFDTRRAERLPWCAAIIDNCDEPEVVVCDYLEGSGKINTYLWLREWDYVIVLSERVQNKGNVFILKTAFYVSSTHKKDDLAGRYANRITQSQTKRPPEGGLF